MSEIGGPQRDLGANAAAEWAALVGVAVLGTDRRAPSVPGAGWDVFATSQDSAVQVLDRAAAVVTVRRSGVLPRRAAALPEPAPNDPRPACPPAAARRLARLLAGEHELLLPEWFVACERVEVRLPPLLLPTLLLRGRRSPGLDAVVRRIGGPMVAWLAEAVPELGVRSTPTTQRRATAGRETAPATFDPVPRPDDSRAVAASIIMAIGQRVATWAMAPQLRQAVASLDPDLLAPLIVAIGDLPFEPITERTRHELMALAEFRREMLVELSARPG